MKFNALLHRPDEDLPRRRQTRERWVMDCERRLRTATHPGIQPEAGVRWNFRPTRGEPPNPREPRRGWILL